MRVLVAYGSTRGGTAGLAHMVADAFTRHHVRTDVRRAGDVKNPEEYDAVVVGGALYSNRWHPDAVAFVGRHRAELRQLPVWFFSSGPLDESARAGALAPVPQVITLGKDIDIRGHMTFGGLMVRRHSRLAGLLAWGPEGDFRDRHHVGEWVERIADELNRAHEPTVRVLGRNAAPSPRPERRPPAVIVPPQQERDEVVLPPDARDDIVLPDGAGAGAGPDDEELEVVTEPASDWEHHGVTSTTSGGRSWLRRYLTLDEEEADDDDGLDLLLESAEP